MYSNKNTYQAISECLVEQETSKTSLYFFNILHKGYIETFEKK
jgi:hypothetical protein